MVGVDAVDGEVECWGVVGGVPEEVSCFDYVAVCGEEVVTGINVLSLLPRLVGDVSELVVLGRGDCGTADFVSDERVGVPSANNTSVSPPNEWQPALLRK